MDRLRSPLLLAVLALGLVTATAFATPQTPPGSSQDGSRDAAKHPVIPGPKTAQALFDELATEDRRLFDIIFDRCDATALAGMLADDFAFFHDKFGQIAASPQLRETGEFFNVWKRVDGQWKLSRVYSFDHHPAQ
jgi:hypothetical protein